MGKPLYIIFLAVALLVLLSLVPWSTLTDGKIKDFNLFSDLFDGDGTPAAAGTELIDPELLAAMQTVEEVELDTEPADVSAEVPSDTGVVVKAPHPRVQPAPALRDVATKPSRVGGEMMMEDYSPGGDGLDRIRRALDLSAERPARIAVIGDSYIEGDIFTQDVRRLLQDRYGGAGVGYMPAHSIVQGFRGTVGHTDSGWKQTGIRDKGCRYYVLPGEYHTGQNGSKVTYKGKNKKGLDSWDVSRVLFIAPAAGTITVDTDGGSETFEVDASDNVQEIRIDANTGSLSVTSTVPGLVYLGAWLETPAGVTVDNMSLRGYSGISHRSLDVDLARDMRRYTDYDLIVVEYGINALSSSQSDYTAYSNMLSAVAERLKQTYPNSDIVLMGVGDRGQKVDGEVHSLPTTGNMIEAQRRAARNAGVVFWDTREAMGGEDAVVQWRRDNYINPDYIHLNAKGGARLAELFVNSLLRSIGE